MKDGFITIGAASPRVSVANPDKNAAAVAHVIQQAADGHVSVLVLPRLCLTGCSCGDLFFSEALLAGAQAVLLRAAAATKGTDILVFAGVPLRRRGRLYNCTAALCDGRILGVIPHTDNGAGTEMGEGRAFASAPDGDGGNSVIPVGGEDVPFGTRLLFRCAEMPDLIVGCESGTNAAELCRAGATVIVRPGASPERIGQAEARRLRARSYSADGICIYASADCGEGESTTDAVYGGHCLIARSGRIEAEKQPFSADTLLTAAVDLGRVIFDRMRTPAPEEPDAHTEIPFSLTVRENALPVPDPHPFLPKDPAERTERCRRILTIQSRGLAHRLEVTGARGAVIGVSGGLDSTLALLAAAKAADFLGWERRRIRAVTMPCFGTTDRTRASAERLCTCLGVSFEEIPIGEAVNMHFRDIGHDSRVHSAVYENAQARERTQVLMDLANGDGSLVIGTGDLSELALGWATYNGDHMSGYGVNVGIPKTVIRAAVEYCRDEAASFDGALADVLTDILDTPVSPELLPPEDGEIVQRTEDLVGPYELHDFFLYHTVRWGARPRKIYRLACGAFDGIYSGETILHWLKVFVRRFFTQQFKRSCLPDGPAVGTVCLSPRGAWRMPSDGDATAWLRECESISVQ